MSTNTDLLPKCLTPAQREEITYLDGALLIVAGPGAGETNVVVHRTAWLVLERESAWSARFQVVDTREQFSFVDAHLKDLGLSAFPKSKPGEFVSEVIDLPYTEEHLYPVDFTTI